MINNKLNKTKEYTLNPSALSYLCYHCEYMKQNYDLYNSSISAGITQTLDGIQKKYFLGDSTKIDKKLKDGETIDPYNVTFFSKLLFDDKKRPFRILGKGDAIIKFKDGTCGIVDYKTSKFKKKDNKDQFKEKDLLKKIKEYDPQLHAYYLLYSNLENDPIVLEKKYKLKYPNSKKENVSRYIERTLNRIEDIKVSKPKIFGLVFIYPENSNFDKGKYVEFSHAFKEVKIDIKNFKKKVTDYLDVMHKPEPPEPNMDCCGIMHNFFYDKKKLK